MRNPTIPRANEDEEDTVAHEEELSLATAGDDSLKEEANAMMDYDSPRSSKGSNSNKNDDDDDNWTNLADRNEGQEDKEKSDDMSWSADEFDFTSTDDEDDNNEEPGNRPMELVTPFNMTLLKQSIQNGSDALKCVHGRDVVLVVGKTGTGKSTLIQGLAGKKLVATMHETCFAGQTVTKEVFEVQNGDALPGFDIGHAKFSKTKFIRTYAREEDCSDAVLYLDTPGFEDTDGHEVDIATSVMLSHVARRCNSLRFVILINYASLIEDRGGAMRAILKFIRSFVKDFEKEKKSFIFLFTHTNKIREIPQNDMKGAKNCLLSEIIRTMDGTKDDEVLSILEFMRKSLKKDYPFVDILHPLQMDFDKLAVFIETKLLPVKELSRSGNCGLTLVSQLKLGTEVKSLLEILRMSLKKIPTDIAEVKDIMHTIRDLGEHIQLSNVTSAVQESEELYQEYIRKLCSLIDDEVKKGSNSDHRFGIENAKSLRLYLEQLTDFERDFPVDRFNKKILVAVDSLQKMACRQRGKSLLGVPVVLDKLYSWKTVFPEELSAFYSGAVDHLCRLIKESHDNVTKCDLASLHTLSTTDLSYFIRDLGLLYSLIEISDKLTVHMNMEVKSIADEYCVIKDELISTLLQWKLQPFIMENDDIELFTSRAKFLSNIRNQLGNDAAWDDLMSAIITVEEDIEGKVVEIVKDCCDNVKQGMPQIQSNFHLQLGKIRLAVESFSTLHKVQLKQIEFEYGRVIDIIRSHVEVQYRQLETHLKDIKVSGFTDGKCFGQLLASFHLWRSFDEFLDFDQRFVENCCKSIDQECKARIDDIFQSAKKQLNSLSKAGVQGLPSALSAFIPLLSEMHNISEFGFATDKQELVSFYSSQMSELSKYVDSMLTYTNKCLQKWHRVVKCRSRVNQLNRRTADLDSILHKIEILMVDDVGEDLHDKLKNVKHSIERALTDFSENVNSEFNTSGNYKDKADLLSVVEAMGNHVHATKCLPNIDQLKQIASTMVLDAACKIEEYIINSADWDTMDDMIEAFTKARALDHFVSDQAESRLRTVMALRRKKEADVDSLLNEMLRNQDYKGIHDFLAPLAGSKDQIQKQKFKKLKSQISSSLEAEFEKALKHLESKPITESSTKMVVKSLEIMGTAKLEIGKYMNDETFKLHSSFDELKRKTNQKLQQIVDKITQGSVDLDFVVMNRFVTRATMFSKLSSKFLHDDAQYFLQKAVKKYENDLNSIPRLIDSFFNSIPEDTADQLIQALSNLQMACCKNVDKSSPLNLCYEKNKEKLNRDLNKLLFEIDDKVNQTECFGDGIAILRKIERQLKAGLGSHVEPVFDCRLKIEEYHQGLEKQINEIKDYTSPGQLYHLAIKLDKLSQKSMFTLFGRWFTGETYETCRLRVVEEIEHTYSKGITSLNCRDFASVQSCIEALTSYQRAVGKHVSKAPERLRDIKKKLKHNFQCLCDEAQNIILSSSDMNQFPPLFEDFRGFVLQVAITSQSEDSKRLFSLINQLVFERLDREVSETIDIIELKGKCYNFAEIKIKVDNVRAFGNFVADHYTLFFEEIRNCQHTDIDKWLQSLNDLCLTHFQYGCDLSKIKHYAVLGIVPSSTRAIIKQAFNQLAKKYHPDKSTQPTPDQGAMFRKVKEAQPTPDQGAMFRKVKEARDEILLNLNKSKSDKSRPFDAHLRNIEGLLREHVREYLADQRYELIEKLLFKLPGLRELEALVDPKLEYERTEKLIFELVSNHVKKARVEVDSNWQSRYYRELNVNITDLEMMEKHLKGYPSIFPTSWKESVVRSIEDEIKSLGRKLRLYLKDKESAKNNDHNFRSDFIQIGYIMVEIPSFKVFTKQIVSDVLEACLLSDWGYSYLFELGLSLQRGDDENGNEDENRVAQLLVAEFTHFKEVLTMVWNEETIQKPVEDTIYGIVGKHWSPLGYEGIAIEHQELLESFQAFENHYKSLLGKYIQPDADLKQLANKTISVANSIKPVSCSINWCISVKRQIPTILAGVFALFTTVHSGAAYHRIESSEASELGENLLMKPHNIQVLTLLHLLGCGVPSSDSLESQLMQIRTGEGKSMILGAAACVLGLLGFKVRCVCYSDYLSNRDFKLFQDVFSYLGILDLVKYSKITTLSEDTVAAKGNIRQLTESLLRGKIRKTCNQEATDDELMSDLDSRTTLSSTPNKLRLSPNHQEGTRSLGLNNPIGMKSKPNTNGKERKSLEPNSSIDLQHWTESKSIEEKNWDQQNPIKINPDKNEEILLVDEVDVFFGAEFYGQTYNQVVQLREPEILEIVKWVWDNHKNSRKERQRVSKVKLLPAYHSLLAKFPNFEFLFENEISLMLDQVEHVDDEEYYLDHNSDSIGYKVMDTVSFKVTYGYRTIFAYLKESDEGNLKDDDATLERVVTMPISCGQFSYANINPTRILGVSGTLESMGHFEQSVLAKYGVTKYIVAPSVYGKSNFFFDKAGDGIVVESTLSDYFHKITETIKAMTKSQRAVIVFFQDRQRLNEYVECANYRKLGRQKLLLTEDMSAGDKEFVINKAATACQITISSAVFGRGTDFFCKDTRVQKNGGVHIIQAFLSKDLSEEIQIQGRTARQGKKGSYQMILLESDLSTDFGIDPGEKEKVAQKDLYDWLCEARDHHHKNHCQEIEANLAAADEKDRKTHCYFNSLLASNETEAKSLFQDIYLSMKKHIPLQIDIDLAIVIDVTGSMIPFRDVIINTISSLLQGNGSVIAKLKLQFPETDFKLRIGALGFRDIDDHDSQFQDSIWKSCSHFSDNIQDVMNFVSTITANSSGGCDVAEDCLGAINRCASWDDPNDWKSNIKAIMVFTDAPAHSLVPDRLRHISNVDSYPVRHPVGLKASDVIDILFMKEINLFFCSLNPLATEPTEQQLSQLYLKHPDNNAQHDITIIPMVSGSAQVPNPVSSTHDSMGVDAQHIIFILDYSGSMNHYWNGVVLAYQQFTARRIQQQNEADLVSVVQFDSTSTITVNAVPISQAPNDLPYHGGGTTFHPAACHGCQLARDTPTSHRPVVIFMSDGEADDALHAAAEFEKLGHHIQDKYHQDLELHVIAFGYGVNTQQLQRIAQSSQLGKVHTSAGTAELSNIFVDIASSNQNVVEILEEEIAKRISDVVSDKLTLEYMC
jgi:uncharacterized protein YegL/GTP-binding protein EngB required for normal cell division